MTPNNIPGQELAKKTNRILVSDKECGLIIVDPETRRIIEINESAKSMFGIGNTTKIPDTYDDFISPFLKQSFKINDTDSLISFQADIKVSTPNRQFFLLKSSGEILISGKRILLESFSDITTQTEAELALLQHKDLLQAIYDNSSVGMAILDVNGNFFKVNQAMCEMMLYTEEELLSRRFTVTHPDDLEKSEYILAQLKEGKIRKNIMEKRYIRKDGTVIHVLHNLSVVKNKEGKAILFIVQAQDITSLQNTIRKAIESEKLKTSFLQNLSHEIRTPANAIFGFHELMKDPSSTMEEKENYMNLIESGVEQFIQIITNVVDISKIETGQLLLTKEQTDIRVLLEEIYLNYKKKFNTENTPGIDFALYMPKTSEPVFLFCDPVRLKQTIGYLLDNAMKFTTFGFITIGFHIVTHNQELTLFVKDTGIGIPIEKQEYIFSKFRQGDESATRRYGGLGIGLTLAQELTRLQGGRLWLTSEPDLGTSVFCSFPYNFIKEQNKPSGGHREFQQTNETLLSGKTLLIADDNESNFMVLEHWFKKQGAKIIRAHNGLEAVEICHHNPAIDLVLMDLQMPILNGFGAAREILSFRPDMPVIAQTAYSLEFENHQAKKIGCVAYLEKPIDLHSLSKLISQYTKK